jgi:hypothetical protein
LRDLRASAVSGDNTINVSKTAGKIAFFNTGKSWCNECEGK